MALLTKPYYIVERRGPNEDSWYEVMLSPFKTFEDSLLYIKKYKQYYPPEHQNYKITYQE